MKQIQRGLTSKDAHKRYARMEGLLTNDNHEKNGGLRAQSSLTSNLYLQLPCMMDTCMPATWLNVPVDSL